MEFINGTVRMEEMNRRIIKDIEDINDIKSSLKYQINVDNETITISEYLGNYSFFEIPEIIDGKKVTGIDKYAFTEHRELEEIVIPSGVVEIGAHAFYNCRNLNRICMPDCIRSMGDGAFKNCGRISYVEINRINNQMYSLKELLAEVNQDVTVMIHNEDGDAVLVFPYFMHHYEENTPARIINQITIGSGLHYRQCVSREDVSYSEYDSIFGTEKNIDVTEAAYKISLLRMAYPYRLSKKSYDEYREYIYVNRSTLIMNLLKRDEQDTLEKFLGLNILERNEMENAIEMARSIGAITGLSVLLQYQNRIFGAKKKTFDF